MNGIDTKILETYVATANSGKYKSWDEVNSKFPELSSYDPKLLETYVATANSGKYKSWDEVNSKFPEFFSDTPQQVEQKKNTPKATTPQIQIDTQQSQRQPTQSERQYTQAVANNNLAFNWDFSDYSSQVANELLSPSKVKKAAKEQTMLDDAAKIDDVSGYATIQESTRSGAAKIDEATFGQRADGTQKGNGYLGVLKAADGSDVTEYSIGINIDGKEVEIPTIVPTLTDKELRLMLDDIIPNNKEIPQEIVDKSIDFYKDRTKQGLSPFADNDESVNTGAIKTIVGKIGKDQIDAIMAVTEENKRTKEKYIQEGNGDLETVKDIITGDVVNPDNYETVRVNPYPVMTEEYSKFEADKYAWRNYGDALKSFGEMYGEDVQGSSKLYNEYRKMYDDEAKRTGMDKIWENVRTEEDYDATFAELDKFNEDVFSKFDQSVRGETRSLSGKDDKLSTVGLIDQNINYVMSGALTNSLVGRGILGLKSVMDAAIGKGTVGEQFRKNYADQVKIQGVYTDIPIVTEIAAIAAPLALDALPFGGVGAVAGGAVNTLWKGGANVLIKMGVKPALANYAAIRGGLNIAKSSFTFGGTLAQYNALMAYSDELTKKKFSELDRETDNHVLEGTWHGLGTGMAAGAISGVAPMVIQRINNKMIKQLYTKDAAGKFIIKQGDITKKIKAAGITGNVVSTFLEGGTFTVVGAAMTEDGFSGMTWQDVFAEAAKFVVAMKLQPGSIKAMKEGAKTPFVKDPTFRPEKAFDKKSGFDSEYTPVELKDILGVKNKAELIEKAKDPKFIQEVMESPFVPQITKAKLLKDSNGIYLKKTFDITESVYRNIDGQHYLVSYGKEKNAKGEDVDVMVDIRKVKSEAEGRNLEVEMYNINLTKNAIKSVEGLSAEHIDKINAEYEKNPRKLLELNEALEKVPSQRPPSDNESIRDFLKIVKKFETEVSVKETEKEFKETKEVKNDTQDKAGLSSEVQKGEKPIETKPDKETGGEKAETGGDVQAPKEKEVKVAAKPKEAEFKTIEVEGKEYKIREKEDGTHEIKTENDRGIEVPLRTAEGKNLETSKKVIEKFKETEKGKTLKFAAEKEKVNVKESQQLVFKSIEMLEKNNAMFEKRGFNKGVKETKKEFESFVNNLRQSHKDVSKFLTNAENKAILTQVENATRGANKTRLNATKKIAEILNKAHDRMMTETIAGAESFAEKTMTTSRVDKQKQVKVAKVDPARVEFVKSVREKAAMGAESLQEKLKELEQSILIEKDPVQLERLYKELEVSLHAWDFAKMNMFREEFNNATNRIDKQLAFNDYMDAFAIFQAKDPMGAYKEAVKERKRILEEQRKPTIEFSEAYEKRVKFTDAQYKTQESYIENSKDYASGKIDRSEFFEKTRESVLSNPDISKGRKNKLISRLERLENKIDKSKSDSVLAESDMVAVEKLLNVEAEYVQKNNAEAERSSNFIQRGTIQMENVNGLMEMIGSRNSTVKKMGKEFVEKLDQAAIKYDKLEIVKIKDMLKLETAITEKKHIKNDWAKPTMRLGVKEPIRRVDEIGKDGTIKEGKTARDWRDLSYQQIVYLNQAFKTASFREVLKKEFSPESVDILEKHVKDVVSKDAQLQKISDMMFKELLPKVHKIINEQYKKENGVDLESFDDYVAFVARSNAPTSSDSKLKSSLLPNAAHVRKTARSYETKVNTVEILDKAYSQAIKYNAFADANKFWNNTLRTKDVEASIKTLPNGKELNRALEDIYKHYPDGVAINDSKIPALMNKLTVSKLMLNLSLAPKQFSSFLNVYVDFAKIYSEQGGKPMFAEFEYVRNIGGYGKEFIQAWRESLPIQNRLNQANIEPSLKAAYEKDLISLFAKDHKSLNAYQTDARKVLRKWREIQMLPVKGGDIAALLGAKPLFNLHYKQALKDGLTGKEAREYAMDKTYISFVRSNQSVWAHNMSPFQYSYMGKMFGYWSSPIQMGQQFRSAARTLINPSSSTTERKVAVKGVIYYGAIQQLIFLTAGHLSNGMIKFLLKSAGQMFGANTDPENSWKTLKEFYEMPTKPQEMIGWLMSKQGATQGIPFLSDAITSVGDILANEKYYKTDPINKIGQATKLWDDVGSVINDFEGAKWNFNRLTKSQKNRFYKIMMGVGDASTGWGFSSGYRYYEQLTGMDIYKAAEKDNKRKKKDNSSDVYSPSDDDVYRPNDDNVYRPE